MLPEKISRILAAAVDGELTPRQQRAVDRLLRENDEARQMYKMLKGDSGRLKALPREALPAHFSSQVLQAVGERPTPMPKAVGQVAQKYLPMWAIMSAAAAVMFAISLGTYMIAISVEQQKASQIAGPSSPKTEPKPPAPAAETKTPVIAKHPSTPAPEIVEPLPAPRDGDLLAVDPPVELPETAEPENDNRLAIPFNPKIELFTVGMPKLPPILPVRDLDRLHTAVLKDSMNGQDALHLDLFTKDANKSFDLIQKVLAAQGKKLFVEALAQYRLRMKLKTNYVFYSETLSQDDVTKLLSALAVEEKKAEARKDPQLEKLVVMPLTWTSQRTIALLLGVEPKSILPKSKPAAGLDIQKPISDDTTSSLAKALSEKEKAAKAKDSVLIGLSFNPIRPNPAFSKEVREFLATRKARRPGTLPVMIVVRNLD
jgi:hypothetical protein